MSLQESGEMYLETIYVLSQRNEIVRSIDVSEYMGYSKPSISRAMSILRKDGYIDIDENGHIHLTESGLFTARRTYERHTVLTKVFEHLGVSAETAEEDACKIEHVISDETFNALKAHLSSNS